MLVLAGALACAGAAGSSEADGGGPGLLPAAFHVDRDEDVFLKVSVNGLPPVWMLLDTGTTPSAINTAYAKSIGLRVSGKHATGAGAGTAPIDIAKTTVTSLQCGPVRQRGVPFVVVEFARPGPDGRPIAGVLGYSFLRGRTLALDYRRSVAALSDTRLGRDGAIPFAFVNDVPSVRLTLAGRSISVLLDTGGSYELLITPAATRRLGLEELASHARQGSGTGYGGAQALSVGAGPPFTVGGIGRDSSAITYMPLPLPSDGALGTLFFKDYKLTIDYRSKLVRISSD